MKTIFVVDDNDVNLVTADNALSDDFNVLTMPSASVMFDLLTDIMPSLILLDIEMPGMSGIEAIKVLKSDDRYKKIPIIFLTGNVDAAMEARCYEAGAVDYINKPFSEEMLNSRVKLHF
jgi:putative two-component system response regulator